MLFGGFRHPVALCGVLFLLREREASLVDAVVEVMPERIEPSLTDVGIGVKVVVRIEARRGVESVERAPEVVMLEGIESADPDGRVCGEVPERIEPAGFRDEIHLCAEVVEVGGFLVFFGLDFDVFAEDVDFVEVGAFFENDVEFVVEIRLEVAVDDGEWEVAEADQGLDDSVDEVFVIENMVVVNEVVALVLDVAPVDVEFFRVVDERVEDMFCSVDGAVVFVVDDEVTCGGFGAVVVESEAAVWDGEEEFTAVVEAFADGFEEADEVGNVFDDVVCDKVIELVVSEDFGERACAGDEIDVDEGSSGVEFLEVFDEGFFREDVIVLDVRFAFLEKGSAEGADFESGFFGKIRDVFHEYLTADDVAFRVFFWVAHG